MSARVCLCSWQMIQWKRSAVGRLIFVFVFSFFAFIVYISLFCLTFDGEWIIRFHRTALHLDVTVKRAACRHRAPIGHASYSVCGHAKRSLELRNRWHLFVMQIQLAECNMCAQSRQLPVGRCAIRPRSMGIDGPITECDFLRGGGVFVTTPS